MKRTPLKRNTPMRRGKKMPKHRLGPHPLLRGHLHRPLAQQTRVVTSVLRATSQPIEKPARMRSLAWLAMVRSDPCQWPGCSRTVVDAHHVKVRGGRRDDFDITAIPLCREHHDRAHAAKTKAEFDELHRMLGAYLCRKLPQVGKRTMYEVLIEMSCPI